MKLAIIGIGNVGSALARGWRGKGHQLCLGVRDTGAAKARALAAETDARLMAPDEAAAAADAVVLALPWNVAEVAVTSLGDLTGKIVIDCMNPLAFVNGALALERGHTTSGAETLASWIPGARVVKTLNQVGAEIMADNAGMAHRPVMFMAGDDDAAKRAVGILLTDLGFEPLDAGELSKARLLEPLALLWINQAMTKGMGRDWAFAAVRKP